MLTKTDKGLAGIFPDLPKYELLTVRLYFYLTISLFLGAVVVLVLDFLNVFTANYILQTLSFLAVFILILYFLYNGKRDASLNTLLLLPVPAYFMMISPQFAVFPLETSYNYELYLFLAGLAMFMLLATKTTQIITYLLTTGAVLAGHIWWSAGTSRLLIPFWSPANALNPFLTYLGLGIGSAFLFQMFRLQLKEQEIKAFQQQEAQNRLFHHYFEGIIRISVERDEHGERIGLLVEYINPAFEEFFEVRNSELKGTPAHLLFQKIFRGEVNWQELCDSNKRSRREIHLPHSNKWFMVSSVPVDKNHFVCILENITASKILVNDLNISKHRYKLLLETIPDIFFVIDKEGTYIDYVPKSDSGIDMLAGEIIGSTIFEVGFSDRMVKQVFKSIKSVIETDSIETIEYALEVKGRGSCFFEMRMVRLNKDSVMAVSRDISKQKFAVLAIEEAKQKAEETDMLKSAFLQNISHEVRTPMNAIVGFANLLLMDECTRKERMNFLQIILRNSQILLHIFSDSIKLSKIQSGTEQINKQLYNVNGLINELHRNFMHEKSLLEKDHLRLTAIKGNDNPKFVIFCDGPKVKDIMDSLLDNALKFTHEGEIEFGYHLPGNHQIEFFVKDTGIGIPKEEMEKIFGRFYQIDLSMKREYGGSGIGLSLAKDFAGMLDTAINIESEPGKGSRFSFLLPMDLGGSHLRIV